VYLILVAVNLENELAEKRVVANMLVEQKDVFVARRAILDVIKQKTF
jgi:hypothetical protein